MNSNGSFKWVIPDKIPQHVCSYEEEHSDQSSSMLCTRTWSSLGWVFGGAEHQNALRLSELARQQHQGERQGLHCTDLLMINQK